MKKLYWLLPLLLLTSCVTTQPKSTICLTDHALLIKHTSPGKATVAVPCLDDNQNMTWRLLDAEVAQAEPDKVTP